MNVREGDHISAVALVVESDAAVPEGGVEELPAQDELGPVTPDVEAPAGAEPGTEPGAAADSSPGADEAPEADSEDEGGQ
jgi:hypothetical protein